LADVLIFTKQIFAKLKKVNLMWWILSNSCNFRSKNI